MKSEQPMTYVIFLPRIRLSTILHDWDRTVAELVRERKRREIAAAIAQHTASCLSFISAVRFLSVSTRPGPAKLLVLTLETIRLPPLFHRRSSPLPLAYVHCWRGFCTVTGAISCEEAAQEHEEAAQEAKAEAFLRQIVDASEKVPKFQKLLRIVDIKGGSEASCLPLLFQFMR